MFDGAVISFADIAKEEHGSNGIARVVSRGRFRRGDGESNRIPKSIRWSPATTAGISEVAECFENIWRWNFAFVPGSGAVTTPS